MEVLLVEAAEVVVASVVVEVDSEAVVVVEVVLVVMIEIDDSVTDSISRQYSVMQAGRNSFCGDVVLRAQL